MLVLRKEFSGVVPSTEEVVSGLAEHVDNSFHLERENKESYHPTSYIKSPVGFGHVSGVECNSLCFKSRYTYLLTDWYSESAKRCLPRYKNASTQPRPHMSMASEMGRPRMTSGALCIAYKNHKSY